LPKFQVLFYEKQDGTRPAYDFINALPQKMRTKMYRLLVMLANNGCELRMPYSEHLGDGIFELRAQSGSDITRALYFFYVGSRVIVTNGFVKKTQQTPRSEIEKAKKFRSDFYEREDGGR